LVARSVLLVASLLAPAARAAPPRVALRVSGATDRDGMELGTRLRAELAIAGFDAVALGASTGADRESLERAARSSGSFAAIAVIRHGKLDAEVWVADRVTGKTVLRHVRFDSESPDAAAIFAIRAVELLRASLLELSEAHPSRGEVHAPAPVRAWVTPRESPPAGRAALEAHVGAVVLAGPGGIPASVAPAMAFSWRPARAWRAGLEAWGPAFTSLERTEGSARLNQECVVAFAKLEPVRAGEVAPFIKAGGGAYHLGADGSARDPYASGSGSVWAGAVLLGGGLSVTALGALELLAGLDAIFLAPRPGVVFADRPVATIGRPMLAAQIGVGVQW
jgi:hypothetical protein